MVPSLIAQEAVSIAIEDELVTEARELATALQSAFEGRPFASQAVGAMGPVEVEPPAGRIVVLAAEGG